MYKSFLILVCILLSSCASNTDEKSTATGQRISKNEANKLNLKSAGSIQDLINAQFAGMPQPGSFENCEELLNQLNENEIKIQSVKEREVVAVTSSNKLLTYTFNDGTCLR